jgi:hypothetical protein
VKRVVKFVAFPLAVISEGGKFVHGEVFASQSEATKPKAQRGCEVTNEVETQIL